MQRREMLGSLGALALAGVAASAAAQQGGHHHHIHAGPASASLLTAASECVRTGDICLAHCLVALADGDTAMAECAQSVNELLAACTALQKLVAQDSKYAKRTAALVMEICRDCEKECRKHEKKHSQCKDCGDACAECEKQCKAFTA